MRLSNTDMKSTISEILADTINYRISDLLIHEHKLKIRSQYQDNSFERRINEKKIEFFDQYLKDSIVSPAPAIIPIEDDMRADIEVDEMERSFLLQQMDKYVAPIEQDILNKDIESLDQDINQIKDKLRLYLEEGIMPGVLFDNLRLTTAH